MRPDLTCGTISTSSGVSLPIIDCQSWRVVHGTPECGEGRPLDCETCEVRRSRNGDLTNPPVVGRGASRPPIAPAAAPSSAPPQRAAWRGLGDAVASATKAFGFRPCGGCSKRQEALNRLVPFGGAGSPAEASAPSDAPQAPADGGTPQERP